MFRGVVSVVAACVFALVGCASPDSSSDVRDAVLADPTEVSADATEVAADATEVEADATEVAADPTEVEVAADSASLKPADDPATSTADEPAAVDLREVDFGAQPWTTDCISQPDFREVLLDDEETGMHAHIFSYAGVPAQPAQFFAVELDEVVFGDVTGDGHDNALFFTACFWGNSYNYHVMVWGHDELGAPVQLPNMEYADKLTRLFGELEVVDGAVILQSFEGVAGDLYPHINGYPVEVVTSYRFVDNGWVGTVLSRTHDDAAPAPGTAPATGVTPGTDPEPIVCENSGYPVHDEAACEAIDAILDNMDECLRALEEDPNFVEYIPDSGLFENLTTGAIHGCDI